MLQVTADVFSGRPNPTWVITDEVEAKATLKELVKERNVITASAPTEAGLGFRGLVIEPLNDELTRDLDLQTTIYLPVGPYAVSGRSAELAERLIDMMGRAEAAVASEGEDVLTADVLKSLLIRELERDGRTSVQDQAGETEVTEEAISAAVSCTIELAPYNPGFWNNNPTILRNNNCYNYASNKRTDTFAQPGRGCGRMYSAITCPEVTRAALCDGLHRRYDCFPASESPRYFVALAVSPTIHDYHWYRKMKEGFWGHKPGGTPVRNVDNSGRVIVDPATCNRGPYTTFCGYFYTCRSQKIR